MRSQLFPANKNSSKKIWLDGKYISVSYLSDESLVEFTQKNKGMYKVVDVRDLDEYREMHIEHAALLPVKNPEKSFSVVYSDMHTMALVHCRSGRRTQDYERKIIGTLSAQGFVDIYFMSGGIENAKTCNERALPQERLPFRMK